MIALYSACARAGARLILSQEQGSDRRDLRPLALLISCFWSLRIPLAWLELPGTHSLVIGNPTGTASSG